MYLILPYPSSTFVYTFKVRVWDLRSSGSESWTVGDNESVATLSFHPTDNVLMIGASNAIYFWDWSFPLPFASVKTNSPHEEVSNKCYA